MGIWEAVKKIVKPNKPAPTPTAQPTNQYTSPIGPSRPIGSDTQGNPVFPTTPEKKGDKIYVPPTWFGGSSGGGGYYSGGGSSGGGGGAAVSQTSISDLSQAPKNVLTSAIEKRTTQQKSTKDLSKPVSSVDVYKQIPEKERYKTTFGESSVQSFKNVFNVGVIGQRGGEEYLKQVFEPFATSGKLKKDVVVYERRKPYETRGTITQDITGENLMFKPITRGEQAEMKLMELGATTGLGTAVFQPYEVSSSKAAESISKDLNVKYQEQVNLGMPLETAEVKWQKEFGEKFGAKNIQLYGTRKGYEKEFGDLYERTGADIARVGPSYAKTAGIIGLSLAGPGGLTLASGIIVGESSKGFGEAILGKDLTFGERALTFGGASLQAGLGISGIGIGTTRAAREVDIAKLEGLTSTQTKILGAEKLKGKFGSLIKLRAVKRYSNEAVSITDMKLPIFKTGEETFSITGATGKTKTKYFSFEKEKWITSETKFKMGGTGFTSKDVPVKFGEVGGLKVGVPLEEFTGSTGRGWYMKSGEKSIIEFPFAGGVKESGKVYNIFGIKPTKLMSSKTQEIKFTEEPVDIFFGEKKGFDTISVYHTTSSKNIQNIMKEGLIPSKTSGIHGVIGESNKVFTAISRKTAEGYKLMRGDETEILTINVPKEKFFEAVKKEGVGTIGQAKFDYVPPSWIQKPEITSDFLGTNLGLKGEIFPINQKVLGPISSFGYIKKLEEPTEKGFSIITGGRKSSKQFLDQMYKQDLAPLGALEGFSEQSLKQGISDVQIVKSSGLKGFGGLKSKSNILQESKLSSRLGFAGLQSDLLAPRTKNRGLVKPDIFFKDFSVESLRQPQINLQLQPQKSRLKQEQIQSGFTGFETPFKPSFDFPGVPRIPRIPIIPFGLPGGNLFEGRKGRQARGRSYRYTPSLGALGLGITATKIPTLAFTGIVTRPIIKSKRRKKR